MPFLLKFIEKVKFGSTLNTLADCQHNLGVPVPFLGMQQSIVSLRQHVRQEKGNTIASSVRGIRAGDVIDLVGLPGSGKSYVMNKIATYTIHQTSSHIIYIDLDDRFNQRGALIDSDRLHILKPTIINNSSLETWLEEHVDIHVLWIMLDGTSATISTNHYIDILRKIQKKWAFTLLTTTTATAIDNNNKWDYRFELKRNDTTQMKLIWPMHMEAFIIS